MESVTRTGLTPSPRKKVHNIPPTDVSVYLYAKSIPAPFTLKPFAGLYNPYQGNSSSNKACSLLCNHPVANLGHQNQQLINARDLIRMHIKRSKGLTSSEEDDSWLGEWPMGGTSNTLSRTVLLAEEMSALRASLNQLGLNTNTYGPNVDSVLPIDSVPEELFRRYTQSDSRPLTPAPTLASCNTRRSGSRKCITPEPIQTTEIREKTLLILDLRRSHSQDTISHFGSTQLLEPPLIRIHKVPTRTCSLENVPLTPEIKKIKPTRNIQTCLGKSNKKLVGKVGKADLPKKLVLESPKIESKSVNDVDKKVPDNDEEYIMKRRGKRRKKRARDSSRGPPAFQVSIDPDTMVAGLDPDSHNPSARPSLIPNQIDNAASDNLARGIIDQPPPKSFIDFDILKELRRELTEQIVDSEFNVQRRIVLEEALKTVQIGKVDCDDLKYLQKHIPILGLDEDNLVTIPRMFKRSSVRCELPMDSRTLIDLTPTEYVREYVNINSTRKLLYNIVFNRNKLQYDEEDEAKYHRRILGKDIPRALGEVMGQSLTDDHILYYQTIIGWQDGDIMDFRMFCGICGLFERLMGKIFHEQMPDRSEDPVHEIESADFESLARKLYGRYIDPRIVEILSKIKEL